MKNLITFCLVILLTLFSCTKEQEESPVTNIDPIELINLAGEWTAKGYTCPGFRGDSQLIDMSHNESNTVIAKKKTGDDCVTEGAVTFFGDYDGEADSFEATFTLGSPNNPNSVKSKLIVTVVDKDHLTISTVNIGVEYTRN